MALLPLLLLSERYFQTRYGWFGSGGLFFDLYLGSVAFKAFAVLLFFFVLLPIVRRNVPFDASYLLPSTFCLVLALALTAWHLSILWVFNLPERPYRPILAALFLLYYGCAGLGLWAWRWAHALPPSSRLLRRLLQAGLVFLGLYLVTARLVDWGYLYWSGNHVDPTFWRQAFYTEPLYFLTTKLALGLFALAAVLLSLGFALAHKAARLRWLDQDAFWHFAVVYPLAWIFFLAALYASTSNWAGRATPARFVAAIPEIHLVRSVLATIVPPPGRLGGRPASQPLSLATRRKLERAGLRLGTLSETQPLMKRSIYPSGKPAGLEKPRLPANANLIIIFGESFSRWFFSAEAQTRFRQAYPGRPPLTGNLDELARQSIVFDNLLSATDLTILGEIATLGSFLYRGPFYCEQFGQDRQLQCKFLFLSDVLARRGYTCTHIQGSSARFSETEKVFRTQSFQQVYASESAELMAFAESLGTVNQRALGLTDETIVQFAIHQLRAGKLPQPFLLTLATLDTHAPYQGGTVLASVHSTDRALGRFWDYCKQSGLHTNTALLFVGDHSMRYDAHYARLRGAGFDWTGYDYLGAILYLPGNAPWRGRHIATRCSNLDLAPTLLDLMGLDVANPFLGLSIFSDRPQYPLILSQGYLPEHLAATGERIPWSFAEHTEFLNYLEALAARNLVALPDSKQ